MKILSVIICLGLAFSAGSEAFGDEIFTGEEAAGARALEGDKRLRARAEELAAQMSGTLLVKGLFDRAFYQRVSLEKTVELLSRIHREYGSVTAVRLEYYDSPDSAHFVFETEQGVLLPVVLDVSGETGLISAMSFKTPSRKNLSLASVKEQLAALPGHTGFLAVKLNTPRAILESLHSDESFAIAAVSKLYILGTLRQEGYSWKKVLVLKDGDRSLPPGRMQDWPAGSPLTVYTLALGMISEDDNTAADVLAESLGRPAIELSLPGLGHSEPDLMKPFLKTADVFRLKSNTEAAVKYMNASVPEKYMILDRISGEPLNPGDYKPGPFGTGRIGWNASLSDLCRLMDNFRIEKDDTARDIMAVNQWLEIPRDKFPYAGYKGGAEPGSLSMVWLLRKHNEDWYCLAASWNSGKGTVDERRFRELMRGAVRAIGGE